MIKYIRKWLREHIWRRRIVPKKYHITAKGQYIIEYILNKYINETKPNDYIEEYESSLQKKVNTWRENKEVSTWFYKDNEIDKFDDDELRCIAAVNYLTILLTTEDHMNREKYYSRIKKESTRNLIKTLVEGK